MSDFGAYGGGSEEEYGNIRSLNVDVAADPDNFETWEKLIGACETLEGGLNRNSSPQALATFRDAFDRFLLKFPLLFAYWKKYAEMEFTIAGPESAEMVYERGCASITNSVDLWEAYCAFKIETTHEPALVREVFERAAAHVGLDFFAHPFWDRYLQYEDRQDAPERVYALLARIIPLPSHQYARYFDQFRQMSHTRPLTEVATPDILARLRAEVDAETAAYGSGPRAELEIEREIRAKLDTMHMETFQRTQQEVASRWQFESVNKRSYFHVTEVDHTQLKMWREYLDFEEAQGDFNRIVCLYERCLVTSALYEEFWLRYARWMSAQPGREEEVRNIYIRAATVFVPISRPGIRLQWAYFEESCGRINVALDIHEAILLKLPDCVEVIVSWAQLERRQRGVNAAIQIFKEYIDTPTVNLYTKAALVAESAFMLWKAKGSTEEARAVFLKSVQWYADSRIFWQKWFQFEMEQPFNPDSKDQRGERMKHVFSELISKSRLSPATKKELAQVYMEFLVQSGGKDAMKMFLEVDREVFGPSSVSALTQSGNGATQNGAAHGELDEASKSKAEAHHMPFYAFYSEPDNVSEGPVSFV